MQPDAKIPATATPWTPYSADELAFNFEISAKFAGHRGEAWAELIDMLTLPAGDC